MNIFISFFFVACDKKLDVIYGIPTSTSMSAGEFQELKSFIKDNLRFLNIANDKIHVSFVPYSDSATQSIKLDQFYTRQALEAALDNIQQSGSGFNIAEALNRASDNGFTIFGGTRPSIPKVMILLAPKSTSSQAAAAQAATKLKSVGAKLITVSWGPDQSNQNILKAISSQPKRKFSYHSPDVIGLNDETNNIINTACYCKYDEEGKGAHFSLMTSCIAEIVAITILPFIKVLEDNFKFPRCFSFKIIVSVLLISQFFLN